jgi:hypothetical protein
MTHELAAVASFHSITLIRESPDPVGQLQCPRLLAPAGGRPSLNGELRGAELW